MQNQQLKNYILNKSKLLKSNWFTWLLWKLRKNSKFWVYHSGTVPTTIFENNLFRRWFEIYKCWNIFVKFLACLPLQILGNSDFLGSKRKFGQSQVLKTFSCFFYYYFEEINIFCFNLKKNPEVGVIIQLHSLETLVA